MNTEEIINQFKDVDELKELYLEYVDKLELKIGVRSLELSIKDVFVNYSKLKESYAWDTVKINTEGLQVIRVMKTKQSKHISTFRASIYYILKVLSSNFKLSTQHIKQQLNESIRTNI